MVQPGSGTTIDLSVTVNATAKGEKLIHHWSRCVGAGRAAEGLRAAWLEQLKLVKEHCGFAYCRFHGIFHDELFVYREEGGIPFFNWQYVDELFDRMLDIGVRPFVELAFMPKDLASTDAQQFWWKAYTSPPKDYAKWGMLVSAFTQHCIDRYGIDEVRQWYFEVWNEPNLKAFWDGTKSQYFELYKTSINAIKAIDTRLRVGGPATSNFVPDERFGGEIENKTNHKTLTVSDINALDWQGVWIKDFLAYCAVEKLPVDFVSTHPYPTDWALDPATGKGGGRVREVNATRNDLEWLKNTLVASAYPTAEIHLTEWSSSPSSRDSTHDSLQAAAYVIKANLDNTGLTSSLSYWTFTDVFEEQGAGQTLWHGGFGLINYQGIVKPTFHAYRMLHALGNEVLHQEEGLIVTRQAKTGKLIALVYHYPPERTEVVNGPIDTEVTIGSPRRVRLLLNGLTANSRFRTDTLDQHHGFGLQQWRNIGEPAYPTRQQISTLKKRAMTTKQENGQADGKGIFRWEQTLDPWACVLIQQL